MDAEDEADEGWEMWEYPVVWEGEFCTCTHTPEGHTWGGCTMEMGDGTTCPCPAGWVE